MNSLVNDGMLGAYCLGLEEIQAVANVLQSKELFRYHSTHFPSENDLFESELGAWLGSETQVCSVASGTAGLRAALIAAGVKAGDSVAVSAVTFVASASAVLSIGARPVPVELGSRLDMDIPDLNSKLGSVSAVITVYFPGQATNVEEVTLVANRAGVPVIEDACQALGVSCRGRPAGTIGSLGVYSFQQSKQLCAGEGGAVVSSDTEVLARVRRFADHGACRESDGSPTWEPPEAGFGENLRMSELQASVLRVQLARISEMLGRQRSLNAASRDLFQRASAPLIESVDPSGDSGSYIVLLAPSFAAAVDWQVRARAQRLVLRHFWRQPFFALPPFARAGLDHEVGCPRALSWSGRLLGMPLPPLSAQQETSDLLAAVEHLCDHGTLLWG